MITRITIKPGSPAEDAFKKILEVKTEMLRKVEKAKIDAQLKPV
jgi:hypothetical protein